MTRRSETHQRENGSWGARMIIALLFTSLLFPHTVVYGFYLVSFVSADIWNKLLSLF